MQQGIEQRQRRRYKAWCVTRWIGVLCIAVGVLGFHVPSITAQSSGAVYVVPIRNEIDLGVAPYLARVLDEAAGVEAQAVVLEIDTPGGRLDAVLQMRDTILQSPVRTIAYVNRQAFSAGALIALTTDELYMAPAAVLGAATPVDGSGTPADAKTISAVRSVFRATAELRNRDPLVAEAMVDSTINIDGLVDDTQLLTLTTQQAQQIGYLDGVADDRQALLAATGLADATLVESGQNWAETLVRFLTNSVVASLLVSLGLLLILVDVYTGGFGAVGAAGLALIGIFFWGHFLVGLAGWEGVALVGVGLLLILLEVFVIPGFGIAGILGVAALLGGVFVSLFDARIVTRDDLLRAGSTVLGIVLLLTGGTLLLLRFLPRAAHLQGLILQAQVGSFEAMPRAQRERRYSWLEGDRLEAHRSTPFAQEPSLLTGAVGVARTDLRPGGIAEIAGARVDVVSQGEYIAAGSAIEVIADEGYRRVVRRIEEQQERMV